jgi:hypothetical protein
LEHKNVERVNKLKGNWATVYCQIMPVVVIQWNNIRTELHGCLATRSYHCQAAKYCYN